MKTAGDIFLGSRFLPAGSFMVLWFVISFFVPVMYLPGLYLLGILTAAAIADFILLFGRRHLLTGEREVPARLSLSDRNTVKIRLHNLSGRKWHYEVVDELPVQFQVRDFMMKGELPARSDRELQYEVRPTQRGDHHFGHLNVFVMTGMKLLQRRIAVPAGRTVPVYPSIIQMKRFEMFTLSSIAKAYGIRKMRRIGHSYEFEQIKTYVRGDDVRQINWKSTARNRELMINQFEDERAQPVYNIIDKSRIMLMPFNGLSLMDHAINTSLVISNAALRKQDRVGLITFSDRIGSAVKADRKHGQLQTILEALYNQKERDLEANFELLYFAVRNMIQGRSLLILYTNFESMYGLKRALPVLRKLGRLHLLLLVFFEDSELEELEHSEGKDIREVYTRILAGQAMQEKRAMAQELNRLGIQTLISKPENLTVDTLNKYLEIKSRGMI